MTERLARQLGLPISNYHGVILSVSGDEVPHIGQTKSDLLIQKVRLLGWNTVVVSHLPGDASLLIGMDAIRKMGGIRLDVNASGQFSACFHGHQVAASVRSSTNQSDKSVVLEDADYQAKFNGQYWEVAWMWKGSPPVLKNRVAQYSVGEEIRNAYDAELDRWVDEGWLVPCNRPDDGIVPLLAVEQVVKNKVRPVLDYRELNVAVQSHTANSDVCPDTLRRWRLMGDHLAIVDLKNAYLQLRVRRDLQEYQIVCIKGQYYRLTRLGFGLSSAPKIMTAIVRYILNSNPEISKATDHYVDDIVVDTELVDIGKVVELLSQYGLITKSPETLNGARVLGLQLIEKDSRLLWRRGREVLQSVEEKMSRRELFSICGRLVGHYPICGWLRVACSFLKRHAEGRRWEDRVGDLVTTWLRKMLERVERSDPVQGVWAVPNVSRGRVWCDASSLATGVVLEIENVIAEDAAWLRKKEDAAHINVAELDSVVRGLNMAIRWRLRTVKIMTDSATVCGWVSSVLTGSHRVKSNGLAEMLVKRRLSMVAELIESYAMEVTIELVASATNKADILTRVPQEWLRQLKGMPAENETCSASRFSLKEQHERHHFGVERTLQLARQLDPGVSRNSVERIVKACQRCNSIDPAPVKWKKGSLNVDNCWERVAIDITHYNNDRYLTAIDCGPSRFTVWRKINMESSTIVAAVLESIVVEFGPPTEILMDNSATFRSEHLRQLFDKWAISSRFRCAYRASGNGIVERIHRTVKRISARSNISPQEAVFWYNLAPTGRDSASSPSSVLFNSGYKWRNPHVVIPKSVWHSDGGGFKVGELVFVKPANPRCTAQWPIGRITAVLSEQAVEVDGIPRHVADCRIAESKQQQTNNCDDLLDGESTSDTDAEGEGDDGAEESSSEESTVQDPWQGRLRQFVRPPDRLGYS